MKRNLAIAAAVATIGIAGLGAGAAHAATSSNTTKTDPMSSIVDAISSKFNLNKTEVQQVFDEQKTKMDAERETQVKEEVAKLVTDKKITQAQADLINAKREELDKQRETNKDSFTDLTQDQRKAKMDEQKTALEAWAKDNGIDTQYLRYVMGGKHGHGGPRGPRGSIDKPTDTSSTNQ